MPAFALCFVGQEASPPRLREFDREPFFTLTSADVAALGERFCSDHRLPAALMSMLMRVAGRPLDGFNPNPAVACPGLPAEPALARLKVDLAHAPDG